MAFGTVLVVSSTPAWMERALELLSTGKLTTAMTARQVRHVAEKSGDTIMFSF
jgi:hypothetical protein